MIILGNGHIYLNKDELIPFVCPQCNSPILYTEKPYVWCSSCGIRTARSELQMVEWAPVLPN